MTLEARIARAFALDDRTWARHANPWSVWSRTTALPLLVLAAWSRAWIGPWWYAALAVALLWTWLNPRLFAPPRSTRSWASRAVLGERVWLARRERPVPAQHRVAPNVLSAVAAFGGLLTIWGVVRLAPWPTACGMILVYAGKLWFLDRMVWLYDEASREHVDYAAWLR
jgi:hypothetical protein